MHLFPRGLPPQNSLTVKQAAVLALLALWETLLGLPFQLPPIFSMMCPSPGVLKTGMGIPLRRRKGYSTKNSQSPRISVKTLASVKCLSPPGPLSLVWTLFEYDLKVEKGTCYC